MWINCEGIPVSLVTRQCVSIKIIPGYKSRRNIVITLQDDGEGSHLPQIPNRG